MADLFLLSQAQLLRIEWYFPLSHGIARVDGDVRRSRAYPTRPASRLNCAGPSFPGCRRPTPPKTRRGQRKPPRPKRPIS